MMKQLFILVILLLAGSNVVHSQDLNTYKYIIVPQKFDFQKESNQYKLNELAKFLFEKNGFEVYMEGEDLPADLRNNRCSALLARVSNESGFLLTKLSVQLLDCNNNQVYISDEGKSKKKDYQVAHQEALRDAFNSMEGLNYNYTNQNNVVEVTAVPARGNEVESTQGIIKTDAEGQGKDENLQFIRDNIQFSLKASSAGYHIFQKGMPEPFAILVKSAGGDFYMYSSVTAKGISHFDDEGNLVVEVFNPDANSLQKITYKREP